MAEGAAYREVAEAAWTWVQAQVRGEDGPWMPVQVVDDTDEVARPWADRDSLYDGIAGLAPLLAEISLSRQLTDEELALANAVTDRLLRTSAATTEAALYFGMAGQAMALRLLAPGSEQVVVRRLAQLVTREGWPTADDVGPGSGSIVTDVVMGTAGTVMTLVWAGAAEASTAVHMACDALLQQADRTPAGLDWGMRPDAPSRMPNYSHGTAGVAAALAVAGHALDRDDVVDASVQGAAHLVSLGAVVDGVFRVPHTVPPSSHWDEPYTYTWCHGTTGTSYLFAALEHAGVRQVAGHAVADLRAGLLRAPLAAGVPRRLRPGFWDNDGRCCGTAGVGEALLDAAQSATEPEAATRWLADARVMGDALVERVVRDGVGARWQFVEHRNDPPLLPPGTSWMQGAAGIAAHLFRLARVLDDGHEAPVVDRPDQWWAVPAAVRTTRTSVG